MNRDGDRYPILSSRSAYPDTSWRGITDLPPSTSLKRRLRQTLTAQPQFQTQLTRIQKQLPVLQKQVEAQIQQQLPRIQKAIDEQMQQMPARIEYMRHAHKQKFGKNLVRGLIAVSGALSFWDLALVEQIWL